MSELILHMLISIVLLIQRATEKSDANVKSLFSDISSPIVLDSSKLIKERRKHCITSSEKWHNWYLDLSWENSNISGLQHPTAFKRQEFICKSYTKG